MGHAFGAGAGAYSQAPYAMSAAAPSQSYYQYAYEQQPGGPSSTYADGSSAPQYMQHQPGQQHYVSPTGSGSNSPYMISPPMNGNGEGNGAGGRGYPPSPPLDVEAPYVNQTGTMAGGSAGAHDMPRASGSGRPKASKPRKPSSNYADSAEEDTHSPTLEPAPAPSSRSLSSQKRKGLLTTRACDECRAVKRKCKREEGSAVCDSCAKANRRCTFSSTSSTTAKRQAVELSRKLVHVSFFNAPAGPTHAQSRLFYFALAGDFCSQLLENFSTVALKNAELHHLLVGPLQGQAPNVAFDASGRALDGTSDPGVKMMLAFIMAASARTSANPQLTGRPAIEDVGEDEDQAALAVQTGFARQRMCQMLEEKALNLAEEKSLRQQASLARVIGLTFGLKLICCGNASIAEQSAIRKALNAAVLEIAQAPALLPEGVTVTDVGMTLLAAVFSDALGAFREGENPDLCHADIEELLGEETATILDQAPDAAAFKTAVAQCTQTLQIISVCQLAMIGATRFFATKVASRKARRRPLDADAFRRTVHLLEAVLSYACDYAEEVLPGIHAALPFTGMNPQAPRFRPEEHAYLRIVLDSAVGILLNVHVEPILRFETACTMPEPNPAELATLFEINTASKNKLVQLIPLHAYFGTYRSNEGAKTGLSINRYYWCTHEALYVDLLISAPIDPRANFSRTDKRRALSWLLTCMQGYAWSWPECAPLVSALEHSLAMIDHELPQHGAYPSQ